MFIASYVSGYFPTSGDIEEAHLKFQRQSSEPQMRLGMPTLRRPLATWARGTVVSAFVRFIVQRGYRWRGYFTVEETNVANGKIIIYI